MSCQECRTARATNGQWNRFDSRRCPWCAARQIQFVARFKWPREQVSARRTEILKEAVTYGLDEAAIRKLVKGPTAFEPIETTEKGKR